VCAGGSLSSSGGLEGFAPRSSRSGVPNLDPHQVRQGETQGQAADGSVTAGLPETYQWLLVPEHRARWA